MSAFAKEVEVAKEMGLALPMYDTHAVSVSSFLIDFFDFYHTLSFGLPG
jgi:hypothetical protein